jgi:hypothetical protein
MVFLVKYFNFQLYEKLILNDIFQRLINTKPTSMLIIFIFYFYSYSKMSKRASYNTPQSGRSQSPPVDPSPPAKQSPAGKAPVSPPKNNQPSVKSTQPPAKTQPAKSAPKETPKSVPKGSFDPTPWVKQGHPQELVIEIKNAFDLFDTDQGGSIDTKGTFLFNFRTQSCNGLIGF